MKYKKYWEGELGVLKMALKKFFFCYFVASKFKKNNLINFDSQN